MTRRSGQQAEGGAKKPPAVPVWSWRDAILKSGAPAPTRHVCLTIACYLSDAGKGWAITVKQLMADTGLSNKTIATHLQSAVDLGLLAIERVFDDGGRRIGTKYLPRFPEQCTLPAEAADMHVAHDEAESGENAENEAFSPSEPPTLGRPSVPPSREPPSSPSEHPTRDQVYELHVSKEAFQNPFPLSKTPPLPPARRGARARQIEFDNLIEGLRTPERARALELLVEPIVRLRRFRAPDPAFALRQLLDWPKLARLDDRALADALAWLKAERGEVVKPSDIEAAVEKVAGGSDRRRVWAETLAANRLAVPAETLALWLAMLDALRGWLGKDVVGAWFDDLHVVALDGDVLRLAATMRFKVPILNRDWADKIAAAARMCGRDGVFVEVIHADDLVGSVAGAQAGKPATRGEASGRAA